MKMMVVNIGTIVERWLQENGYDGLFNEDGDCACKLSDLSPCEHLSHACKPGYLTTVCPEGCDPDADWWKRRRRGGRDE